MPVLRRGSNNMMSEKEKEKAFVLKRAKGAVISRDFSLAARLYKGLLKEDSANIALLSALGSLYVKAGDDQKALLYYKQICTFSPNNLEALNSMGGIFRRLKKYDESIRVLQQALEQGLNDAQVNYNLGFTYRSMGAYDEAIECFESVIDEKPDDVLAYNHLGAIYALRKDHQKAVTAYKRGLQVDPNHPILQLNLARSFRSLHEDGEAAAAYEAALRAKPGWLEAVRDYTELLLRHRKTKDAAELVKKSIKLYPSDIGIQSLLGRIYLRQYDFDSAMQTFERASRINGNDTDVLTGLAEAYEKGGKAESAVEVMEKAGQVHPDDASIEKQYAHALLSADNIDDAGIKIKQVYDTNQKDVQALDLYGQYYICLNEDDRANLFYKKINSIDPSYDTYKKEASARYKQIGRLDKARHYLEQYIAKHAEEPAALIALARLDEAAGNMPAALADYHKALKYDQFNVLARREVQRLGDVINEAHKKRKETEPEGPYDELEIVMNPSDETVSEAVPAQDSEQEQEEGSFDFDIAGDNLLKDDDEQDTFALADTEDDEAEKDEEPQGLDQLIPSGLPVDQPEKDGSPGGSDILDGGTGPSDQPPDESALERFDDGFGTEDIEEPAGLGYQPPENDGAGRNQAPETEPSGNSPFDGQISGTPPFQNTAAPQRTNAGQPEGGALPQADLSDRALGQIADAVHRAAAGSSSLTDAQQAYEAARKTYDAAQTAADRAWMAADQAADSAQSAGDAIDYINQMTEEAAIKAAEAAVKNVQEDEAVENQAAEDYDHMIDKAAALLPDIVSKLENKENAEKFVTELELFKKLRALCEYLPPDKKEKFMASRTRLLLDYVIAKLSGRPGLIATAEELRKKKLLPAAGTAAPTGLADKQLALLVLVNMRTMVRDLPDAHLAKALDDIAAEALKTL
jgi:tetratricopeptide (TPR) repeat protein